MIAGLGSWFLTIKGIGLRFMGPRLLRLVAPLIFATAFINVFGRYATSRMTGDTAGLASFGLTWLIEPKRTQGQHLWFLTNLSLYTLICWPTFAFRERLARAVPR